MSARALVLLALALLAGCEPRTRPSTDAGGEPAAEPPVAEPLDALSRRLGQARQRMRGRGYQELPWSTRIFLPAEGARASVVRLRRGTCTTFLVLAGGSVRELETALYDSDGRQVAVDSVRGEGSLVHACPRAQEGPPAEAVYYLTVRAHGGAGAVSFRAFESQTGAGVGFTGLFDGIIASPGDHRAELAQRIERTLSRLESRDMEIIAPPVFARVLEGEALRVRRPLVAGRCYVAVTRTSDAVRDLAVYLLDPDDTEVARDLGVDDEARLELCAPTSGDYVFEARASEGSGDVALAILEDPSAAPSEPPEIAVVPSTESTPRTTDAAWQTAVAALLERGYREPTFVAEQASIRPGETATHDVRLPAGCSVLVAVPRSADTDLDLYLRTDDEITLRDTRITAEARLISCRAAPRAYRATVKAYGDRGQYWLALLKADPAMRDVGRLRLLDAAAPYAARGYQRAETVAFAANEASLQRAFSLAAGECVALAAAGSAGVEDVDLELRDADGRVIASDTGPDAWASVSRCAPEATRFEVRALVYRGAGEILLETWRRGGS